MFTIKIFRKDGTTEGRACESYVKSNGSKPPAITLVSRGERDTIDLDEGDQVFVENALGKTIDVIRAKRAPP